MIDDMDQLDSWDEIIEDLKKEPNKSKLAVAYCGRGLLYFTQYEMIDEALEDLKKSIEIFEALPEDDIPIDPFSYPYAYSCRGMVYEFLGEYEQALEDESKGIEIYELLARDHGYDTNESLFQAYSAIGQLLNDMSRYDEAIAALEKSIRLGKKLKTTCESFDEVHLGGTYQYIGNSYDSLEDFAKANIYYNLGIEIYERVLKESGELWDLPALATAYMNRAANHFELNDIKKALSDANRGIEIREMILNNGEEDDPIELAQAYNIRGQCYIANGDILKGIDDKIKSLRILKQYLDEDPERANEFKDIYHDFFDEVEYLIKEQSDEKQLKEFYSEFMG